MSNIIEPIDMEEVMEILGGDQELLIECFDELLSSLPRILVKIQSSIKLGDASGLDKSAHKLKGSLKYMAAGTAADVAYQLEVMGKEKNLGSANDTFRIFCDECDKVRDFMEQHKAGSK